MGKLKAPEAAGWNAGKNYYAKMMRVEDIKTDPEIARLFDYQEKMVDEVCRSIMKKQFDKSQPLSVWKDESGKIVLVDGHTRLAAARKAGLKEVPVVEMEFAGKDDAILYTFERQVIRRNLSSDEILTAVELIRKPGDEKGKEVELLARRLGIGSATVSRAKKVLKEAPAAEIAAIRRGEKTIGEVHKALTKPKAETVKPKRDDEAVDAMRQKYVKETVILLAASGEAQAARLVVNHFYQESEREAFVSLLPEAIRALLSRDNK